MAGRREGSAVKKHIVTLTADERARLSELARTGKAAAYKLTRARILLKADQADGGPAWPDQHIARAARQVTLDNCGVSVVVRAGDSTTVATLNAAFHLQGVAA
jgi:hypothetical protein